MDGLKILHDDILRFAAESDRSNSDALLCVKEIGRIASSVIPDAKAHLFGSQAANLALDDSDIDIVVLAASIPDVRANPHTKGTVVQYMDLFADAISANSTMIFVDQMISRAAVPILKCSTASGRKCDISFGVEGGVHAVRMMKTKMNEYPAIRPTFLVLKQLLKEKGLNEVYSGGLSSYGLFHMVLSFLASRSVAQDDGVATDDRKDRSHDPGVRVIKVDNGKFPYFSNESSTSLSGALNGKESESDGQCGHGRDGGLKGENEGGGREDENLGQVLIEVLNLYGNELNPVSMAVHPSRGLVPKLSTRLEGDKYARDGRCRLSIVDMMEPTHDISQGCFNTPLVLSALSRAAAALKAGDGVIGDGSMWEAGVKEAGKGKGKHVLPCILERNGCGGSGRGGAAKAGRKRAAMREEWGGGVEEGDCWGDEEAVGRVDFIPDIPSVKRSRPHP